MFSGVKFFFGVKNLGTFFLVENGGFFRAKNCFWVGRKKFQKNFRKFWNGGMAGNRGGLVKNFEVAPPMLKAIIV